MRAIVVTNGGIAADAIIAHSPNRRDGIKAPYSGKFNDSIPPTAAGKIVKKALRIEGWGENARMVN